MVILDRVHLKIADQNLYFQVNEKLEHGNNILEWPMGECPLFFDRVKVDEQGQPIMSFDPVEGDIPSMETVRFDKEIEGVLSMDFLLDTTDGTVSSAVLRLPKGVDAVLGYNISTSL